MSQLSETSQPQDPDICLCGEYTALKTSRTSKNPGRRFFNCAVGTEYGGCDYFRFIDPHPNKIPKKSQMSSGPSRSPGGPETPTPKGLTKFELQNRLRESLENEKLLQSLFRKSKEKKNHLKVMLGEAEIERDKVKQRLMVAEEEEKENRLRMLLYGLLVVFSIWQYVIGLKWDWVFHFGV